jgi:bifunctional UDP-N-acetylglucosamine pyrophosphorylase/glucosamine-1-phosphate N-acetyltransferase
MKVHTIILAAGSGSRMRSKKAKSLQKIAGQTMLERIIKTAQKVSNKISIVVGFDKDGIIDVASKLGNFNFVDQKNPKGTGHAVMQTIPYISDDENVLVLYGDVPLIKEATLKKLINNGNHEFSVLTSHPNNPKGYGRIIKNKEGNAVQIIEEKDANDKQKLIDEVFTGNLCIKGSLLQNTINKIKNENAASEYYLTDLIQINSEEGVKINTSSTDIEEVLGANSKIELELLEDINRKMKAKDLQEQGVTIVDSKRLDIRGSTKAGSDCHIDVNVILEGEIMLGDGVEIGPNVYIKDSKIGDNTQIKAFSFIEDAEIGNNCSLGPYARIREGSQILDEAKIGNFVETKKSIIGKASKANHFSYLGDSTIGDNTNIGAGAITCNYDGKNKNKTTIGDNSFIGTNSSLVAPVTIGSGSYVAAGSVITKDVPDNALGISRPKQENKRKPLSKK